MRRFFLIAIMTLPLTNVRAQLEVIDSLKAAVYKATTEGDRLEALFQFCSLRESLERDTLLAYAKMARDLAAKTKDHKSDVRADYFIAYVRYLRGQKDSALSLLADCKKRIANPDDDPLYYNRLSYLTSSILVQKKMYKEGITGYYAILQLAEQRKDTMNLIMTQTNIGWVYMEMNQNREALSWLLRTINIAEHTRFARYNSKTYNNIAGVYSTIGQFDSAEYYVDKVIEDPNLDDRLTVLANAYNIKADVFMRTRRTKLAEPLLREALALRKQIGDPYYIVSDMYQLALYYANNGEPAKGIELSKEGIRMAQEYQLDSKLLILYESLAESYRLNKDDKGYAETLKKIIDWKDSTYTGNSAQALADLKMKYDVQKKENTIIQQELSITKKNYLFFGLLLLSFFAATIGWVLFNGYRKRQRIKLRHMQESEKRLAVISVKEAEEKERKRIAADLHDSLGANAASIASNLDYIMLHENKGEPSVAMKELQSNSQAIVSQLSDTIWAINKESLTLTAISDRLKVFIGKLQPSYPNIEMEVTERVTNDQSLPPTQAFHLFRIMQEAITNAVKHSGAKVVCVLIEGNDSWRITIADNGKGMYPGNSASAGGGNGLVNMKNRAMASGWEIAWLPREPQGISVVIHPTTN